MISLSLFKTNKRSSCFLIGTATGLLNEACNSLPLGQITRATSTSRDSLAVAARRCWNGVTSHMYVPLVTACPSTITFIFRICMSKYTIFTKQLYVVHVHSPGFIIIINWFLSKYADYVLIVKFMHMRYVIRFEIYSVIMMKSW